jgi:anion-transporting  ArsA/GET3 family ATPase
VTAAHGSLDAMMLDMKRTFDEIVLAHAAPDKAQQIFDNPFYQALSSSFAGTQEYMAMEKLGQLQASGMYDLIIVDTPPTRSALDFLDAPTRMTTLLDSRVLRVLMAPAKAGGRAYTRVLSVGFTAFSKVFTRILGTQLLNDVGQFVAALETMFGGFRQRAESTYRLLGAPGTAFVVIAAPEPAALREAAYFVDRLQQEHMPLAGVVINRVQGAIAGLSVERSLAAAQSLAESGNSPVVEGVLRLHAERTALAARHERLTERFTEGHPDVPVARVGAMAEDVHDLDGLRAIGAVLAGAAPAATQAAG